MIINNQWPVKMMPTKWYFGEGYSIFTRLFPLGGWEIHIVSKVPIRKIANKIIESRNVDWWTTIPEDNKMAINRSIRGGFHIIGKVEIINSMTGDYATPLLLKRGKKL